MAPADTQGPVSAAPSPAETFTVPVADLNISQRYQCRAGGLNDRTVEEYAAKLRRGIEFPPVTVARIGGQPFVVDGFHRVEAHRRAGLHRIDVQVHDTTRAGALRMAALANTTHGLPLKSKDKRRVFRAFIRGHGHYDPKTKTLMSYRELEKALGGIAPHTTLRNWMQKDFPDTFRRMGGAEKPSQDLAEPIPEADPEDVMLADALEAVEGALKAAEGLRDGARRGRLIRALEDALARLGEGWKGDWVPAEAEDF